MASKVGASRGAGSTTARPAGSRANRFWRDADASAFVSSLGNTIRIIRREQKLHQEQLGARIGSAGSRIGEIERGIVSTSAERVAAIASALGMTTATLLLRMEREGDSGHQRAILRATVAEGARRFSLDELNLLAAVVACIDRAK